MVLLLAGAVHWIAYDDFEGDKSCVGVFSKEVSVDKCHYSVARYSF